jgi:arsenite methyltransferase
MSNKPDYGIDAPAVMRNLFLVGSLCLALAIFLPHTLHLFGNVFVNASAFYWPAGFLLAEACLYLLYVKFGKFRHRDFMLAQHTWRGDEQVLDVGTGRGLLLAGAAKRIAALNGTGHATGIDIWSTEDLSGNSPDATAHNLALEGVTDRCTLVSKSAAEIPFADASFDVVVSNLCLHNLYDKPTRRAALRHIARVLKPGGIAIISDFKLTTEYADEFRQVGLAVTKKHGSFVTTFPPLTVVIARKI